MKVTAVHTHVLDCPLDQPFESASGRFDRRTHLLVEIETDSGLTGWGECLGPAYANRGMVDTYAPVLIGMDPRETEKCWLTLYHTFRDQGQRGVSVTALSGIDIALWDIAGQAYGVSVSTLLGGRFRDQVSAYATGGFRRVGGDRMVDLPSEVASYKDAGFHATKIKIGFGVKEDLDVIRACRAAMGPEMRLMIDANHGYDVSEAIALGRAAAEFDIDWFEEPVIPETLNAYCDVRAGQPIPVAGGETWHGRWAMQSALEKRCVDILQPDIAGTGGFTEGRRIADLCGLHNTRLVPHVWGTGVHLAAALQFLAALPPNPPRPEARAPILEFDQTHMPFRQAILTAPIEAQNGVVDIPSGPGLGVTINRDALETFAPRT